MFKKFKEIQKINTYLLKNFLKDFLETVKRYNETNKSFNNEKINFINLFNYYFETFKYQNTFILTE